MWAVRTLLAGLLGAVVLAPALQAVPSAQSHDPEARERESEELVLHAYTFKYRPASEAIALVHPLLSQRGTVELQPSDNTLVVRDTPAALNRIVSALRSYDRPARPLRLEIFLVRASRTVVSPAAPHSDLPELLTQRLRSLLPFDSYDLEAQARLSAQEGQAVTYSMGGDYEVGFHLGTLTDDGRVRLSEFRITRRLERKAGAPAAGNILIHTNLNLWLDQTISLGLARNEASREALMVVLTLRKGGLHRPPADPQ
jgi:type II/III secretion system protein